MKGTATIVAQIGAFLVPTLHCPEVQAISCTLTTPCGSECLLVIEGSHRAAEKEAGLVGPLPRPAPVPACGLERQLIKARLAHR